MNARCSGGERMTPMQQHVSVHCCVVTLCCHVENLRRVLKQCVYAVFEHLRRAFCHIFTGTTFLTRGEVCLRRRRGVQFNYVAVLVQYDGHAWASCSRGALLRCLLFLRCHCGGQMTTCLTQGASCGILGPLALWNLRGGVCNLRGG